MKKVLVTGGAGFIGSHTVDLLLHEGVEVCVLDNLSSGSLGNLPFNHPKLKFIEGSIENQLDVDKAMRGVTHCLHLAAQVSVAQSLEQPVVSSQCNVQGFLNILDAARKHGLQRVVYASSAAVYGKPKQLPLDESSQVLPMSPYGLEKLIDEQYASLYSNLYGVSTMGLRYFNVFGPRQDPSSPYSGVISIFMDRVKQKKKITIYGEGNQTRDFVFVADVAKANVKALRSSANIVCNVATGESVTLLELLQLIYSIGGEVPIEFQQVRQGDIPFSEANPSLLVSELSFEGFTPLSRGLKALWDAKHFEA